MASIKNLIREIHRRSLWQVLGIFLAASWGVLQVVEVLTEAAGLPDWTPTMALVALLVGLPICLATAFVQEGMPGQSAPDADDGSQADAPASVGDAVVQLAAGTGSLDRPSTRPSRTRRLLTWRNAVRGGVGAFALLGLSVGAYFVMWTAGVGPVGNLVAQGVITEGAQVLVADFADGSGQGYADAVSEALRIDLREASVLEVVEGADIVPTLRLMRVEPGAELTAERALEVAQRQGIAAVLDGQVTSLGTGYSLTATLREAQSGRSLASFRASAGGPDELIASTDQLSQDIREKSGESLRTIRAGTPLEQATTSSLEALKLYSEASDAWLELADAPRSAELMELALVQDSTFAMGWRMLSIALQDGGDPSRRAEAIRNAFRYRDRVQDVERYTIEGTHYAFQGRDIPEAVEAYRNTLRVNPDQVPALNNLSNLYRAAYHDFDGAEELLRRGINGPRPVTQFYSNLISQLLYQGRLADALELLDERDAAFPNQAPRSRMRYRLALAQGDLVAAADNARRRSEDVSLPTTVQAWGTADLGLLSYWEGQLDQGRRLFLRAEALDARAGGNFAWIRHVQTTYGEALWGDAVWARGHLRDGLESIFAALPPVGRDHARTAIAVASSGDVVGAELVIGDWREVLREEGEGPSQRATIERATLYARVAGGDTVGAAATMDRLLLEWGCSDACWSFDRARMHDRMGQYERALELYLLEPNLNTSWQRLFVLLRLGPLYEELGETEKAIEAYQRIVDQWAEGDARGREVVERYRDRITALGG
ncbi:MAG: tetratricopeptide repeat protein [Longimicrobiales bacterium]